MRRKRRRETGRERSGMRSDNVCKHKDTRPNGKMGPLTEDEGEGSACVAVSFGQLTSVSDATGL